MNVTFVERLVVAVVFDCSEREKLMGMSVISFVVVFFLTRCERMVAGGVLYIF
jgi:hypothetical protein